MLRNRSLVVKLTAAFVVVGIAAIVLVTLFVVWQTSREFNRFMVDRFGADLSDQIGAFYDETGSLEHVQALLEGRPQDEGPRQAPFVVVNLNGDVVYGKSWTRGPIHPTPGSQVIPITAARTDGEAGKTVGYIVFHMPTFGFIPPQTPEQRFVVRVQWAALVGALGAIALALILGILFARSLTRPLTALTEATRALARGELGRRVDVHSRDELGQLGLAFNQMSGDLEHSMHLRRQMTADIAHDLRTPLSVILGYSEALDEGKFAPSQEVFSVLHDEALHLNRLIDDLRLLSLADAGELALRTTTVPPGEILNRAAAAHRLAAEQRGITIQMDLADSLPEVRVDGERMAQVLGNLIGNAIRHTPSGGTITLRSYRVPAANPGGTQAANSAQVALEVADTGEGIPADEVEYIFDRFYRGDKARRQTGESGLGLAIARSIVEALGGAISVKSQVGVGTTFTVTLPEASAA